MRVSLERVRESFPNPTEEQNALIGPACLALTEEERTLCQDANDDGKKFERFIRENPAIESSLRASTRLEVCEEALQRAEETRRRTAAAAGAAIGGSTGAALAVVTKAPIVAAAVLVGGGAAVGGYVGYHCGAVLGERLIGPLTTDAQKEEAETTRLVYDRITSSPEFIAWAQRLEEEAIDILKDFVDPYELRCPLSLERIQDPVLTEDGHIYERAWIVGHLAAWEANWQRRGFAELPQEAQLAERRRRSPLRIRDISAISATRGQNEGNPLLARLVRMYDERVYRQRNYFNASEADRPVVAIQSELSVQEQRGITAFYGMAPQRKTAVGASLAAQAMMQGGMATENPQEAFEQSLSIVRKLGATLKLPQPLAAGG